MCIGYVRIGYSIRTLAAAVSHVLLMGHWQAQWESGVQGRQIEDD